jgi:hypothetical protein
LILRKWLLGSGAAISPRRQPPVRGT